MQYDHNSMTWRKVVVGCLGRHRLRFATILQARENRGQTSQGDVSFGKNQLHLRPRAGDSPNSHEVADREAAIHASQSGEARTQWSPRNSGSGAAFAA